MGDGGGGGVVVYWLNLKSHSIPVVIIIVMSLCSAIAKSELFQEPVKTVNLRKVMQEKESIV